MIALGIDQSSENSGIAVANDNEELIDYTSVRLDGFKTSRAKRKMLKNTVKLYVDRYDPEMAVIERVRMFSQNFVSLKTIISLGSLVVAIDDAVDIDLYSVDTRSWKSRVVGEADASKEETVEYIKNKFNVEVNHDIADAICIALYPFQEGAMDLLEEVT